MKPILQVDKLTVSYGPIEAVRSIDFHVGPGECVALLGANGAGKTTTLLALSGLIRSTGVVTLEGISIAAYPSHERFKRGLVQVPEGRGIFQTLSVEENLDLVLDDTTKRERSLELERMYALFPRLKERRQQWAGNLSGGEQQMLALARALLSKPKVLMLDEPSMGLSPKLVDQVFETLARVHQEGLSLLIVEQNAFHALGLASRAYVLNNGEIELEGNAAALRTDPRVVAAYLGGS